MRQNLELPGGRVDQGSRELVLRTMGRVESAAGFRDLIVANQNGYPVRIKDIGRVEDSFEEPRGLARLDGRQRRQPHRAEAVGRQHGRGGRDGHEALREAPQTSLPPDIETFVVKDQSTFIVRSIEEVNFHLVIAAVLVALTILLFIQDWRTTIIASLAIPASIISHLRLHVLDGLHAQQHDDARADPGHRHRDRRRRGDQREHLPPHGGARLSAMKAASTATREIALAVSATTMSLLVIFLPVVFMGGRVGRFFSSFGATVAFAIFMSWFVSFTMTPMLCSRFLKLKKDQRPAASRAWSGGRSTASTAGSSAGRCGTAG